MKKILGKFFPIFFLFFITCLFFYKSIFKGLIPIPGDMLVGAYYPWLDYKWGGFVTSVPIKNPLITDVFSQFYLWKKIIVEQIKNNQFPFWNIYSYSGYPLFANFHSGVLNPFNIFMIIFGDKIGWALLVMSQSILSCLTMFILLKQLFQKNKIASIIGSITYGFSGFIICWSQFVTAGFAMIWLPLIFLNIEKFFDTRKIKYILSISILYLLLMTSGHLQSLIYGSLFSGLYFLFKLFTDTGKRNILKIKWFSIAVILGFLLMSVQLLSTLELGKNSIRFNENYIQEYNYGLLSLDRIVTLFAPDYYGNPVTYNFWGSFNYHETIIYCGILSVFALIYCVYNFKKLKIEKFFLFSAFISLLLVFNTFIGKSIYISKIPGISTSAAGRIVIIFVFCASILSAYFIEHISSLNFKTTVRYYWGYSLFLFIISVSTLIMYKTTYLYPILHGNYLVAARNLFIPIILSCSIAFILIFIKNNHIKRILILFIVIVDLFRFGWKYTPFVNREYIFPKTDITTFLQNQPELFRIEKEKGPLLTPNTWTAYGLSSTSGYDPMAIDSYSNFYHKILNNENNEVSSRYSEIDNYDAVNLGEGNVKYLLALKYNEIDEISPNGKRLNYKINLNNWEKVYEYGSVVILENKKFKPRIEILNQDNINSVKNIFYSSNKISFNANSIKNNSKLVLRDTWYPGWKAYVNGNEVTIDKYLNIYRQINIPKGENKVEFIYHPKSFYYGLYISAITMIIWLFLLIKFKNKKI